LSYSPIYTALYVTRNVECVSGMILHIIGIAIAAHSSRTNS